MSKTTSVELGGIGQAVKRKEDSRFIQGKGRYVEDFYLPGMVYGAFVRSPFAHARVKQIDTSAAMKVPGVLAVITAKELHGVKLAWMPTLAGDTQAVLADEKVLFQSQEVAFVVAESQYQAADGVAAVEVDYEELPVVIDPFKALEPNAPILRTDKKDQKSNRIFHWEVGDKKATEDAFRKAGVVISQKTHYQRCHPAPMETCGCVVDHNPATGHTDIYMTSQAPHAHRTVFALVAGHAGLVEHKTRVIAPDIGGGFGNKVPVYPGYVLAAVASVILGRPCKWIESRSENIQSTGFARDYHTTTELAATKEGRLLGLRVKTVADHGAFNAHANPSKWPAGLFSICTGSYDIPAADVQVDAVYTNKAPGGVAYRCSFRVTEASYIIERAMDSLARELKMDPTELRRKNFVRADQFPYATCLGWEYDSGDYHKAMQVALDAIGYDALRKEQAEKRKKGELMGIGISSFTEIVGAGPRSKFDILGLSMNDGVEIRVHPTGTVLARTGVKSQGQGHETTFAQIIAEELGIPESNITLEEGDTDTAPYGLGTYASRSTPVAGAATALAARRIREKAKKIAAYLLEASEQDIEWKDYQFQVKGVPGKAKTMAEVAFAAYTNPPPGMETGLETSYYYDPPNLTYPFGTYVCVLDIDSKTGEFKIRRFVAVDDCGTIINPMVVDGQIHGGLTEGFAIATMQEIRFDEQGNCLNGSFMDYLLPTAVETPRWELGKTVTPSPHHPIGAKGVGESPNVGSPAAFVNAFVDALSHLGVKNIDMPVTPWKIWRILREKGVA
ncbi:MAG: carbon-monoxide dehydrogenase large subunit [Candidatus Lambdaproteobacteria bacterium]|nr:carbon-monoxide dehydrogenase large subunit [Candidatus Lambdaproteobacteria bacterium]